MVNSEQAAGFWVLALFSPAAYAMGISKVRNTCMINEDKNSLVKKQYNRIKIL